MKAITITRADAQDRRFSLHSGAGSDAIHTSGEYAFAVTQLHTDCGLTGCGITLTMGNGNRAVCDIIDRLTATLFGREIEELMAQFGWPTTPRCAGSARTRELFTWRSRRW